MTREFHIKGIPGLILFVMMAVVLLLLSVTVPSLLLMVLWNAVVFEVFKGPAIQLFQGVLLALMTAVILKVLLQPSIEVHFRKATSEELAELRSFVESHHVCEDGAQPVLTANDTLVEQTVEINTRK